MLSSFTYLWSLGEGHYLKNRLCCPSPSTHSPPPPSSCGVNELVPESCFQWTGTLLLELLGVRCRSVTRSATIKLCVHEGVVEAVVAQHWNSSTLLPHQRVLAWRQLPKLVTCTDTFPEDHRQLTALTVTKVRVALVRAGRNPASRAHRHLVTLSPLRPLVSRRL